MTNKPKPEFSRNELASYHGPIGGADLMSISTRTFGKHYGKKEDEWYYSGHFYKIKWNERKILYYMRARLIPESDLKSILDS